MIQPVILAAGLGRRMKASKPLLDIHGQPALGRLLDTLTDAALKQPVVVLGHRADLIQRTVDLSACHVAINPRPEDGMGSSLAIGLDAVLPQARGVLVFHADMPLVRSDTVRAIVAAAETGCRIAIPTFDDERGFPVYFARETLAALRGTLTGDIGGRTYVDDHLDDVVFVPVEDSGCVIDFDRPDDLAKHRTHRGGTACSTCA